MWPVALKSTHTYECVVEVDRLYLSARTDYYYLGRFSEFIDNDDVKVDMLLSPEPKIIIRNNFNDTENSFIVSLKGTKICLGYQTSYLDTLLKYIQSLYRSISTIDVGYRPIDVTDC